MNRGNEIGFPCVNLPECVIHFAEPDSVGMDIWVKGYDLLEVQPCSGNRLV